MGFAKCAFAAAGLALLTACGGGGGGSSVPDSPRGYTMKLSPATISVTASQLDPAPTATVSLTMTPLPSQPFYLSTKASNNLVSSVTLDTINSTTTSTIYKIQFVSPLAPGVGSHTGTFTMGVFFDSALTKPIDNSPQEVPLTYTVTPAPAPVITTLNPTSVTAGSPGFTLQVSGQNFDYSSGVNWNGYPCSTTVLSSTQLSVAIPASNLTSSGTVQVTVYNGSTQVTSAPVDFTIL